MAVTITFFCFLTNEVTNTMMKTAGSAVTMIPEPRYSPYLDWEPYIFYFNNLQSKLYSLQNDKPIHMDSYYSVNLKGPGTMWSVLAESSLRRFKHGSSYLCNNGQRVYPAVNRDCAFTADCWSEASRSGSGVWWRRRKRLHTKCQPPVFLRTRIQWLQEFTRKWGPLKLIGVRVMNKSGRYIACLSKGSNDTILAETTGTLPVTKHGMKIDSLFLNGQNGLLRCQVNPRFALSLIRNKLTLTMWAQTKTADIRPLKRQRRCQYLKG